MASSLASGRSRAASVSAMILTDAIAEEAGGAASSRALVAAVRAGRIEIRAEACSPGASRRHAMIMKRPETLPLATHPWTPHRPALPSRLSSDTGAAGRRA